MKLCGCYLSVALVIRMISKLQQIEPRMRAIEDTARDGIVSIDERGSIQPVVLIAC